MQVVEVPDGVVRAAVQAVQDSERLKLEGERGKTDEIAALLARLDLQCNPVVVWPKLLVIPSEDPKHWRWVELHIQNTVNYVTVFKVKTTTRKEFMVQPAKGLISPMSTLVVKIGLQPGALSINGKFQVVAVPIVSGPPPPSVDGFWGLLGSSQSFSKKVIKWVIAPTRSPPPPFSSVSAAPASPPPPPLVSSSSSVSASSSAVAALVIASPPPGAHAGAALSPLPGMPLPFCLNEFLITLGIRCPDILKICAEQGIDDASYFHEYSLDELIKIGIKPAHARRIKGALSRTAMRAGDTKNEDAPPAYPD